MNNDITEKPCKNHIDDSISQERAVKYAAVETKRTAFGRFFPSMPHQNPGVTSFQFMSQ